MTQSAQGGPIWQAIEIGEDLGSFDYVMTAEMMADYRRVVDNPDAAYPTVAARHPAHLFYRKYGGRMRVPNTGQDSEYANPPIPGKRITVTGRIADKYVRRDKPYLVVEAEAVDEDGRLIETSRLVALARESDEPAFAIVARKWGT